MLGKQLGIKLYLHIQTLAFKKLGIDITNEELNWRTLWKIVIWIPCFGFILIAMGYHSWQHIKEVAVLAEVLPPFFEFVLVYCKIGVSLYKYRHLVVLLKRTHKLSLRGIFTKREDETFPKLNYYLAKKGELKILVEENSNDAMLGGLYYTCIKMAFAFAALQPFGNAVLGYMRTGEYIQKPFFVGSYPFKDNFRSPYCFIIYLSTIFAVYFGAYVCLAVESLHSWYMHNIVAHFRILQQQLDNFGEDTSEANLRNWIHYHQQTLALAKDLSAIYSPILFVQFTLNSIRIGLIGYQLIQIPPLADFVFLMVFTSVIVVQPAIYCYGGQRMEVESGLVAMAIYNNWPNWSMKCRKLMLLPLMRAQNSCKLSGIFFEANFSLYLWVLRTTSSYITLLWSTK